MDAGINHEQLARMDLWQWYAYLKVGKEHVKEKMLEQNYLKTIAELLFWIMKKDYPDIQHDVIFKFEKDIEKIFTGKDELDGLGEYKVNPETGEKEWVYNYRGIMDVKHYMDRGGAKAV